MLRWIAVLILVLGACGGATRPPVTPPAPPRAPASLLAYVPADTPYLMNFEAAMLEAPMSTFDTRAALKAFLAPLRALVLAPAQLATAPLPDRLASELIRELDGFDAAAARRIGWRPGVSAIALYGYGLVPVLRVRLDGARAQAAVRRVLARARVTVAEARWQDVPYVVLPSLGDGLPPLVLVFHRDQVVAAFAQDLTGLLPHLTAATPLARSFAATELARVDPDAPAHASLAFALAPAHAATRLQEGTDLTVLGVAGPRAACVAGLAALMRASPTMVSTAWNDGRHAGYTIAIELSSETATRLAGGAGVPHWLPRDDRARFQLGLGVPLASIGAAMDRWWRQMIATRAACGRDGASDDDLPAMLRGLGPLAAAPGATALIEQAPGTLVGAGVVALPDVASAWAWLARRFPLGPLPPHGEVRPLAGAPDLHVLALPTALAGSAGAFDPARLRALATSPGRPGVIAAMEADAALQAAFDELQGKPAEPIRYDLTVEARMVGTTLRVRGTNVVAGR